MIAAAWPSFWFWLSIPFLPGAAMVLGALCTLVSALSIWFWVALGSWGRS